MIIDYCYKTFCCKYYAGYYYYDGVCFSSGFNKGNYKYHTYITYIIPKTQKQLSLCFLTKKEIIEYSKELSSLLGFSLISLSESKEVYYLQIKAPHHRRYLLYISTFIRYMYEHPFSILLYCALKSKPDFPKLDSIQIIQLYLGIFLRCCSQHAVGTLKYIFDNRNIKSIYNTQFNNFNTSNHLVYIPYNYSAVYNLLKIINTKNLPEIAELLKLLAKQIYIEYEKDICRW